MNFTSPVFHCSYPEGVALHRSCGRLRLRHVLALFLPLAGMPQMVLANTPVLPRVQVVLGVPQTIKSETLVEIRSQLSEMFDLSVSELSTLNPETGLDVDDAEASDMWKEESEAVLGVGRRGCQVAARSPLSRPVLCVLLSAKAFTMLQKETARPELFAIVVDQPMSRQARVATSIYPELKRFSFLSQAPVVGIVDPDIEHVAYIEEEALAGQITHALVGRDALIATPEHEIFNRSTLRTVLLTAYGYAKPVIGYSRAYVKAGALISSYSSSTHAFRQVAELLPELLNPEHANIENAQIPQYFSIADNPSVARSLGLIKRRAFAMDASYSDDDFAS